MDWDRAVNLTCSSEMQKSLLHMKTSTKSLCYNDFIINNLVLKEHKRIMPNATEKCGSKKDFKQVREINLKCSIYKEKIINLKNQLRDKQQLSSTMEGKLSSYRSELKNLASRANKLEYDTKDIDNTSLLFKQKLKLLKEESSEFENFCDYSRILLKQLLDPNSEQKERTLAVLKECCNVLQSKKGEESDTLKLAESIEKLTKELPLMQLLQGGKLMLKQYYNEMTSTLTGTEALKQKTEDEKVLESNESNFVSPKMKCIQHDIERKCLEMKVTKHRHNLRDISNQIFCLIMVNTSSDQEHTIKSWITLNLRNEVSNAMELAYEEHLSSAAVTKVDVDFLKLKLLSIEKVVLQLNSECKNIKQYVPQDLKSTFKVFWINLDRVSVLFKEKFSELIKSDNSLKTTEAILTNNKDKYLLEFGMPFSSLTFSTKNYQQQFLEAYGMGNSIPLYSAHCTALNIIKRKQLFSYLCKEQPMSVISLFKNITKTLINKPDEEAYSTFVLQIKMLINTTQEVTVKSREVFSVLWEHPFCNGLPEQILVKCLTPKQWMANYSMCLQNI